MDWWVRFFYLKIYKKTSFPFQRKRRKKKITENKPDEIRLNRNYDRWKGLYKTDIILLNDDLQQNGFKFNTDDSCQIRPKAENLTSKMHLIEIVAVSFFFIHFLFIFSFYKKIKIYKFLSVQKNEKKLHRDRFRNVSDFPHTRFNDPKMKPDVVFNKNIETCQLRFL